LWNKVGVEAILIIQKELARGSSDGHLGLTQL
jgi:hypothetical protein